MHTPPLDFIVLGLPRSATTWIANWLTTDRTLCLHDPFAMGEPETWPVDYRRRGICCTTAYVLPGWLNAYHCPIAVIERDPATCDASLAKLGLPGTTSFRDRFETARGARFEFDALWNEGAARALWEYLLPSSIPFDALRWRLLKDMHIEPYWKGWMVDVPTLTKVVREARLEA